MGKNGRIERANELTNRKGMVQLRQRKGRHPTKRWDGTMMARAETPKFAP